MRISYLKTSKYSNNVSFKSTRTDKNTLAKLKNGEKPIIENEKLNIYAALNNLAANPTKSNIEFLFDTVENLEYGQRGNSKYKKLLSDNDLTPVEKENTDWFQLLKDTIQKALANSTEEDSSEFSQRFNKVFENQDKELTPVQAKLLDLSKSLNNIILNESILESPEKLAQAARIRENTSYFLASSEISYKQKQECMEKFLYFMSDDYKINPQLEDKKLQVLDEMLNDLLIKTPKSEALTIKSVDQRLTGMCAAISICRKQMAYEDKSNYVDIILDELNDSPIMHVYDVTALGSGNKVEVPKANIDYNSALEKNYRIIDASAHIWMQNAHASGDGSIVTEKYIPFDEDNYDVFNDSSWYLGLEDTYTPHKKFLATLIKEKEALKSLFKKQKEMRAAKLTAASVEKQSVENCAEINNKIYSILQEIFPQKTKSNILAIRNSLHKFYNYKKSNDEKKNIVPQMSEELKQKILTKFIITNENDITSEQCSKLNEKSLTLLRMVDDYANEEEKINKLHKYNQPKNKYQYYKNLYNAAAAHRLAVEADLNLPNGIYRYERQENIPPRNIQILSYLNSLAPTDTDIVRDIVEIETIIPRKLDDIIIKLYGKNLNSFTLDALISIIEQIENGNKSILENTSYILQIEHSDKTKTISALNKIIETLSSQSTMETNSSKYSENFYDAIRIIGFEDCIDMTGGLLAAAINSITSNGISQTKFNELSEIFGGDDKVAMGIESLRKQYLNIQNEYNSILSKWNVPSTRSLILQRMEKDNKILSRNNLDILQRRFRTIEKMSFENDSIADKSKRKKSHQIYKFTNEDKEIFAAIEKNISTMKKYSKLAYLDINKYLADNLEKQYASIGMLNGQFWVREEGSTGLSANEQLRIIEQMTGKPYHIETNIESAVKQIKKGEGSGTISLSVKDDDYAFHAMYVPVVTSETFINPITNEKTTEDVVKCDNSWGKIEKETYWNGHNGFDYTDYERGYGWKNGFILSDNLTIGLPVKDINHAIGYIKKDNDSFSLFTDMLLPGIAPQTYNELSNIFNHIFSIDEGEILFNKLETKITEGYRFNPDKLETIDDIISAQEDKIKKRIDKEIKSKKDFDNLDNNDPIKFIFEKMSVYFSTFDTDLREMILYVKTPEELEKIKKDIFEEHINQIGGILCKSDVTMENLLNSASFDIVKVFDELKTQFNLDLTPETKEKIIDDMFFDEDSVKDYNGCLSDFECYMANRVVAAALNNIEQEDAARYFIEKVQNIIQKHIDETLKIKSLNSTILKENPLYTVFIDAIDKYLNPKSDEELLQIIQQMQQAEYKIADPFIDGLKIEDAGLNIKAPYDYLLMYKMSDNSKINKAFSEIITMDEITENINVSSNEESATPEEIYRTLYIKLSDLNVQKYIKNFTATAFQKYKVRQAFPNPVIFSDSAIKEMVLTSNDAIVNCINDILNINYVIDEISKCNNLIDDFKDNNLFNSLMNLENTELTEENLKSVDALIKSLNDIYSLTSEDDFLSDLNIAIVNLTQFLETAKHSQQGEYINGKIGGKYLKKVITLIQKLSETQKAQNLEQNKTEVVSTMKEHVSLLINNVEPKYRNDARQKVNKFINLYKDGKNPDEVNMFENELTDFIVKRHISKNPTELLKECTNMLLEGKQNSNTYIILKDYLNHSLKTAKQTKIQYKLVENQHEGISSKLKDMLDDFKVTLTDGQEVSLNSETGMVYLINNLANTDDKFVTLNLFLEQTGLSKLALRTMVNNFSLDKAQEIISKKIDTILSSLNEYDEINNIANKYFNQSRIKYKSLQEAVKNLQSFVNRKAKNKDFKSLSIYNEYLETIEYSDFNFIMAPESIKQVLMSINETALKCIIEIMYKDVNFINELKKELSIKYNLINSIKVPANSQENILKSDFIEKYKDMLNLIEKQELNMSNRISESLSDYMD